MSATATAPAAPAATWLAAPAGPWKTLSTAMTAEVPAIAGRPVPVACAPGAGLGNPACYLPAIPVIEVDGEAAGGRPRRLRPRQPRRPRALPGHLGRPDPRVRPRRPHPATASGPRQGQLVPGRQRAGRVPHRGPPGRPPPRRPPLAARHRLPPHPRRLHRRRRRARQPPRGRPGRRPPAGPRGRRHPRARRDRRGRRQGRGHHRPRCPRPAARHLARGPPDAPTAT